MGRAGERSSQDLRGGSKTEFGVLGTETPMTPLEGSFLRLQPLWPLASSPQRAGLHCPPGPVPVPDGDLPRGHPVPTCPAGAQVGVPKLRLPGAQMEARRGG